MGIITNVQAILTVTASTVFPSRNREYQILAEIGKSHAAMLRTMLGPVRCDKIIMWPGALGRKWYLLECRQYGDHEFHVDEYGFVFRDEDIPWMERQYKLSTGQSL